MTKEQVYEQLNEIFRDVFDDEELTVGETTTADDVDGWDSLMHITLIVTIENTFGMKFAMNEITAMKNVAEMVDIILSKAK